MEHITLEINENKITTYPLRCRESCQFSLVQCPSSETAKNKYISPQTDSQLLANRTFYVSVNSTPSIIKTVTAGIPQGSIIGTLLFTVYINDIPCTQNFYLAVYADDTIIFASLLSYKNATKYIQAHLEQLQDYFTNCKLKVNPVKIQDNAFTNKRSKPTNQVFIVGHSIPWSPTVKYFGVLPNAKSPGPQRPPKERIQSFLHSEDYPRYSTVTSKQISN